MDPAAILARVLDEPRVAYVRAVLDTYGRAAGGLLANGLAFSALFATIPTALVTLGLAGLLAVDPAVQAALAEALAEAFPPLSELIEGALTALVDGAAVTSIIGVVGLIWTVSQFYVAIDVAFSRIFADDPERDPLRRTARGLLAVGGLLGAVVVVIVFGSLLAAWDALAPAALPLPVDLGGALTSWPVLLVIASGVVLLAYRILPPEPPSLRASWLPALVIGVIVVVLSQIFVFLAPRLVGVAAFAGSLATGFIALAWLSFTFQALLYGAAWVRVRVDRARQEEASALAGPAAPAEPGGGGE
jgi:YihY family inner membrane protein